MSASAALTSVEHGCFEILASLTARSCNDFARIAGEFASCEQCDSRMDASPERVLYGARTALRLFPLRKLQAAESRKYASTYWGSAKGMNKPTSVLFGVVSILHARKTFEYWKIFLFCGYYGLARSGCHLFAIRGEQLSMRFPEIFSNHH